MLRRFVLFLLRKKLKVKKGDAFQFTNQRSERDYYFFTNEYLMKDEYIADKNMFELKRSTVSLNWLLDPECKIRKMFK